MTVWVSGSSFLLLQAVSASSRCVCKKLQGEWVNVVREVLFTVKQANMMQRRNMHSDMHPQWKTVQSSHALVLRPPFHFSCLQWRRNLAIAWRRENTAMSFLSFLFGAVQIIEGALEKNSVPALECRHFGCNQVVCKPCKVPSFLI